MTWVRAMTIQDQGSLSGAIPMSATCSLPITTIIRCTIWLRRAGSRVLRNSSRTSPRSTWLIRMEASNCKMQALRALEFNFRGSKWPIVPHKGTLIHWRYSSLQAISRTGTCPWMLEVPKLRTSCSSAKEILATSIVSLTIRLTKTVA